MTSHDMMPGSQPHQIFRNKRGEYSIRYLQLEGSIDGSSSPWYGENGGGRSCSVTIGWCRICTYVMETAFEG